jgi:hypothetical protein
MFFVIEDLVDLREKSFEDLAGFYRSVIRQHNITAHAYLNSFTYGMYEQIINCPDKFQSLMAMNTAVTFCVNFWNQRN